MKKARDGHCIVTSQKGQRWRGMFASNDPWESCEGKGEVAQELAPEDLSCILDKGEDGWTFIGTSGRFYDARDPLGPLSPRPGTAPERFTRVACGGSTILGMTADGLLFRHEEPAGWQRVDIDDRIFDVAIAPEGRALALALPEALYGSVDGKRFVHIDVVSMGVRAIGFTREGYLGAETTDGTAAWPPDREPSVNAFFPDTRIDHRQSRVRLRAPRFQDGRSVKDKSAVIDGDRYIFLGKLYKEEYGRALAVSRLGESAAPALTPLPDAQGCWNASFNIRGRHLVIVCKAMVGEDEVDYTVSQSDDAGATFTEPVKIRGNGYNELDIAISTEGRVLLTGVCSNHPEAPKCKGDPYLLLREGKALSAKIVDASAILNPSRAPAFSADGRFAYFYATRAKDLRPTLFVSRDGGATFSERPIVLDPEAANREPPPKKETNEEGEAASDESYERNAEDDGLLSLGEGDIIAIRPDEDGTVGITIGNGRSGYLLTNEDGQTIHFHEAKGDVEISGWGRRFLAIETTEERASGLRLWESLDGGRTTHEIGVTAALTSAIHDRDSVFACGEGGCLIGAMATRLGWGADPAEAAAVDRPAKPEPQKEPAFATPIVCELDATAPWTRLEGVNPHSSTGYPTAAEVATRRALWSLLSLDHSTMAAATEAALWPERDKSEGKRVRRSLLGPSPSKDHALWSYSTQGGGYAIVRVHKAQSGKPVGPMRDLEVAWENLQDGSAGKGRIADAGAFDVETRGGLEGQSFETGLLQVMAGGVLVRPHVAWSGNRLTFLLDAKGERERFNLPAWYQQYGGFMASAAFAEGHVVPFGFLHRHDEPVSLHTAFMNDGMQWETRSMSLAPPSAAGLFTLAELAYGPKDQVGIVVTLSVPNEQRVWATFLPLKGDGTVGKPSPLPTPLDLGVLPKACKEADRTSTPRYEAHMLSGRDEAMFPGRRHPVFITDPSAVPGGADPSATMLVDEIILHGTKPSPCVAAYLASDQERQAVIPGDLSFAWMFREAPRPNGSHQDDARVEVRKMTCHFDATAMVPDWLAREPGMFRLVKPPPIE